MAPWTEQRATAQTIHGALTRRDANALAKTLRAHDRTFRDRVGCSVFSTVDRLLQERAHDNYWLHIWIDKFGEIISRERAAFNSSTTH